jgi:hypothetical protein
MIPGTPWSIDPLIHHFGVSFEVVANITEFFVGWSKLEPYKPWMEMRWNSPHEGLSELFHRFPCELLWDLKRPNSRVPENWDRHPAHLQAITMPQWLLAPRNIVFDRGSTHRKRATPFGSDSKTVPKKQRYHDRFLSNLEPDLLTSSGWFSWFPTIIYGNVWTNRSAKMYRDIKPKTGEY